MTYVSCTLKKILVRFSQTRHTIQQLIIPLCFHFVSKTEEEKKYRLKAEKFLYEALAVGHKLFIFALIIIITVFPSHTDNNLCTTQ